jgi:hypothetical protein
MIMARILSRFLYWTPRILGLLFALLISLAALDVFGAGYSFWETVVALLIHLIPVYVLLIGLAVGWRWEWVGTLVYISFSIWYLVAFEGAVDLSVYLVVAGLPFLVGLLFLVDWIYRSRLHPTP